ncbi:MAG: PKD domain-containing protein [Flavobacteriales bacterium]|nr:PKD domain-containing protein [Flavobacteriales bacterium]
MIQRLRSALARTVIAEHLDNLVPWLALLLGLLAAISSVAQCGFTVQGAPTTLCAGAAVQLMLDTTGGEFGEDAVITWSSSAAGDFSCSGCSNTSFTAAVPVAITQPASSITVSVTSPTCPAPNNEVITYTLLATPQAGLGATLAGIPMTTSAAYGATVTTFTLCEDPPPVNSVVDFVDASTNATGSTNLIQPNGTSVPASGTFAAGLTPGTYTVTDPSTGCSNTLNYQVLIGPPVVSISAQLGIAGTTFGCADELIEFEITPTGQSPTGMIYTIHESYDLAPSDNPVAVLTNVPPGTTTAFFHSFSMNSCGGTHAGGPNTAGLEVTPAYGCYFGPPITPITTNGVYISNEPVAAIDGPRQACIGPVTFDNVSQGAWIDNNGVCATQPQQGFWTISGSTPLEWTVAAGFVLGDDGGTPDDPFNWNLGSDPLTVDFHLAGTYTIGFTVASSSGCGASSYYEYDICVETPTPPTSFTVSPVTGCAPFTPTISNSGPQTFGCNGTYEWSVQFLGSDCGTSGSSSCVDCTDEFEPSITFNGAGTYAISMRAVSGCTTAPVVQEVMVVAPPTATIDPLPAQICTGQCITPTAVVAGCGVTDISYAWTFTNTSLATFSGATPPQLCPTVAGVDLGIQLSVTNACGTSPLAQRSVQVANVSTPLIVTSDGPVCEGGTITLTANGGAAGASFTWTDPSGATSPLSTNATLVINNATNGAHNGTWTVSAGSGPCDAAGSVIAVVHSTPPVVVSAAPAGPLCNGGSTTLMASAGAATGAYQWSGGPGSAVWANATPFPPTTTYAVTFTDDATGCTGQGNIAIAVGTGSAVEAGTPTIPDCDLIDVPLNSGSPTGGIWSIVAGPGTINGVAGAQIYTPAAGAGPYTATLQYTITTGGCPGTDDVVIDIPASSAAHAGPAVTACDCEGIITLTGVSPVNGQWTPIAGILDAAGNFNTCASGPGTFTVQFCPPVVGSCTPCDTKSVVVHGVPTAAFDVSAAPYCAGASVSFSDASNAVSGGALSAWNWDFGDPLSPANTAATPDAAHGYDHGDSTYTVTLTVHQGTCSASVTHDVYVQLAPVASFTATTDGGCAPVMATFQQAMMGVEAWSWDFDHPMGNGTMEQDPGHLYQDPGTYEVMLAVSSVCGSDTAFRTVTAGSPPELEPTISPAVACANAPITFTLPNGPWSNVQWDFGDPLSGPDNTATASTSSHLFAAAGSYTVSVTAEGTLTQCVGTAHLAVQVAEAVDAELSLSSAAGCAPLNIALANTASGADDVHWTIEDVDGAVEYFSDNAEYTFDHGGLFNIRLLVEHASGCVDSALAQVEVYEAVTAAFTMDEEPLCGAPAEAHFDNNSTGVGPLAYTWHFGENGASSIATDPSYTYTAPGDFEVCLQVESEHECTASYCAPLAVHPAPSAAFDVNAMVCVGVPIPFSAPLGQATYRWWFGDGATSMLMAPQHSYTIPGVYDVALAVTGAGGCADSLYLSDRIVVLSTPVAAFSVDTLSNSAQLPVYAMEDGSAGATAWYWDFGDGATSTDRDPRHEFPATYGANYTTCLTVANEAGCVDQACTTFTYDAGGNIHVPNAFTPNGDLKNDVFRPVINGFEQCRTLDLWIYDRWGNLVEHLQDRNSGWDGRFNGAEPLIDVYVWRLSLSNCLDGTDPEDRFGHVTIVLDKSE